MSKEEEGWLCGTGSFVLRFNAALSRRYILLLFKSEWVKSYLGSESVGATMTNLNHNILNKLPLLIAPANEQNRIVEKVDEIMTLCDALISDINASRQTPLKLADAITELVLSQKDLTCG